MKKRLTAALLVSSLLGSLWGCTAEASSYAIVEAEYPEMPTYPNEMEYVDPVTGVWDHAGFDIIYSAWREAKAKQQNQPEGYTEGIETFARQVAGAFLTDTQGSNAAISPLNLYLALGMLAEVTDGDTREQIMTVMEADSLENLRTRAGALWNANYCNDGALTSILASSFWLDEDVAYRMAPLEHLKEVYRASAYQGQMGDPAFDKALQTWLQEQTGGLLDTQAENITMDAQNILTLTSTVYYQAKWTEEFGKANTKEGVFHSTIGDISCDFMRQSGTDTYYWEEQYAAVARPLEGGGKMWLILPDEGMTPEAILTKESVYRMIMDTENWTNSKRLLVHQTVPKFDVSMDQDLEKGMTALGVTDVFDESKADFTPLTKVKGTYLSQAKHAVRVAIDEEGVTAASYVVMAMSGAAMPPEEEVDFVLDRPFAFVITGTDDVPLFMGIVNMPSQGE